MIRLPLLGSGLLSLAIAGCTFEPEPVATERGAIISDQLHNGGTEGFLFLPPMVPRPAQLGDVVPELPVRVEVDEVDALGNPKRHITTFTTDAAKPKERVRFKAKDAPLGPEDDGDTDPMGYYVARWKTNDYDLSTEATYRVSVVVPGPGKGRTLGFADVDVVKNQKQFKNVDTTEFTPLVDGQILRIKFRVDRPAVDEDGDGTFDWDELRGDASYGCAGDLDRIEIGVSQGGESDATKDATLHGGPLEVVCGDVRFALDPALGDGAHEAETKVGDKTYTLGYTMKSAQAEYFGPPRIRRSWFTLEVPRRSREAQGLGACVFSGYAALSEGPGHTMNGTPIDVDDWSLMVLDDVALDCTPATLDGEGSAIYADDGLPVQLCTTQTGATVERHAFADLHTSALDPIIPSGRTADFGWLGQSAAGRCPNATTVRNAREAYAFPLTKGQPTVTLNITAFKGSEGHKAALFDAVTLALYTTKSGGEPVLLRTVKAGELAAGAVVVTLPKDVLEDAKPGVVLVGTYDNTKNPPPPPPPPKPSPSDKLDLALDVEVK